MRSQVAQTPSTQRFSGAANVKYYIVWFHIFNFFM